MIESILAAARKRAAAPAADDLAAVRARRRAAGIDPPRPFAAALRAARPAVVAEIKRRAPSAGDFAGVEPEEAARAYARSEAAAVSILADPHFGMSPEEFTPLRAAAARPSLWKDFVLGPAQIDEAYARGADAVLLIARFLGSEELAALGARAEALGLDVLFEVHDAEELDKVPPSARLVGANARDLEDPRYATDPARLARLLPILRERFPGAVLVAESGFAEGADVEAAFANGPYDAILVGTSLLRDLAAGRDAAARIAALVRAARAAEG